MRVDEKQRADEIKDFQSAIRWGKIEKRILKMKERYQWVCL